MNYSSNLEEALLSKKEKKVEKNNYNNLDINLKEWNNDIEDLLKCWGEKCGGLAILHSKDRKYWRKKKWICRFNIKIFIKSNTNIINIII
tara:strand:- start:20076 stop:20345 length:270 start_codon:yes stop_codon:yes gene_type:complete